MLTKENFMRKTLWIAMICGLLAALLLGVCTVSAQKEVFEHYEKKDFEPHMKPLDLTPVRFYVQDEHDGTYTLTLTIKNLSNRSWPAGAYQLVVKRGSNYLAPGSGPYFTITDAVARGETTQIQATLNQYIPGGRMVFYVLDGSNAFYGFYIRL